MWETPPGTLPLGNIKLTKLRFKDLLSERKRIPNTKIILQISNIQEKYCICKGTKRSLHGEAM